MSEGRYVWPETYMTRRDLFRVLSYAGGAVAAGSPRKSASWP